MGEYPFHGTQKGDVYSFAIILRELIYNHEDGPFQDQNRSAEGIVRNCVICSATLIGRKICLDTYTHKHLLSVYMYVCIGGGGGQFAEHVIQKFLGSITDMSAN